MDRANEWTRQLGCEGSVHYVFANATVSLGAMLEGYPGGVEVRRVFDAAYVSLLAACGWRRFM